MDIRLILVSIEGKAKEAYINALKPFDAKIDIASSFKELRQFLTKNKTNGVLVDLKSKIIGQKEDKGLIYEILDQFPLLQLNYNQNTGMILSFHYGPSEDNISLDTFVNERCKSFKARRLRESLRKQLYFNVTLSKSPDFSKNDTEKTITLNISRSGCFIYSANDWKVNDHVMFIFKELSDSKPISGKIKWKKKWGNSMRIPGIGVKFEDISEEQLSELCEIGSLL